MQERKTMMRTRRKTRRRTRRRKKALVATVHHLGAVVSIMIATGQQLGAKLVTKVAQTTVVVTLRVAREDRSVTDSNDTFDASFQTVRGRIRYCNAKRPALYQQ
jgi:hypothetical protein